jgi:hypothetical protein
VLPCDDGELSATVAVTQFLETVISDGGGDDDEGRVGATDRVGTVDEC